MWTAIDYIIFVGKKEKVDVLVMVDHFQPSGVWKSFSVTPTFDLIKRETVKVRAKHNIYWNVSPQG